MTINQKLFSTLALVFVAVAAWAQGPNNTGTYYKDADGKKGSELKTALFNIVSTHTTRSYKSLWDAYKLYDLREDGKIWDIYSDMTNYTPGTDQAGSYKKEGDVYNREHTVPKSWFDGASPMVSDYIHILPTDGYVNAMRGNYPFGETSGDSYKSHNAFSKRGKCSVDGYQGIVFEPNDLYKGDLARIYFYMATAYEDKIASWTSDVMSGDSYKPYVDWQMNMLMRWSENDPVSQKEIDRNAGAQAFQGNRNPFVDYPGLEKYIWGSKTDETFSYDNYSQPTGITEVESESEKLKVGKSKAYNLSGQEVNDSYRGIVIVNGKKYIRR